MHFTAIRCLEPSLSPESFFQIQKSWSLKFCTVYIPQYCDTIGVWNRETPLLYSKVCLAPSRTFRFATLDLKSPLCLLSPLCLAFAVVMSTLWRLYHEPMVCVNFSTAIFVDFSRCSTTDNEGWGFGSADRSNQRLSLITCCQSLVIVNCPIFTHVTKQIQ